MGHGEPEFNLREKADYGGKNIVHAGCWGTCPQKALRCPALRWSSWDSQSVKTTERGGTRGFDGHKWVKGRKRHLLVDTLGMVVARRVEAANVWDRRVGARLLCRLTIRLPV